MIRKILVFIFMRNFSSFVFYFQGFQEKLTYLLERGGDLKVEKPEHICTFKLLVDFWRACPIHYKSLPLLYPPTHPPPPKKGVCVF